MENSFYGHMKKTVVVKYKGRVSWSRRRAGRNGPESDPSVLHAGEQIFSSNDGIVGPGLLCGVRVFGGGTSARAGCALIGIKRLASYTCNCCSECVQPQAIDCRRVCMYAIVVLQTSLLT